MLPQRESIGPLDASSLDAVVHLLRESWPILIDLTPARLGLNGDGDAAFLDTMRTLVESGLISCEAIHDRSAGGPEALGAALTARGREQLDILTRFDHA